MTWAARIPTFAGTQFSLASLFASTPGFDFTDLDITKTWGADAVKLMSKDGIGTRLTSNGDSISVFLDKSTNFALGPELITNGDFSAGATGWSLDAGWALSGGAALHTPGSAGDVIWNTATVSSAGDTYRASMTVAGRTAGQAWVKGPFQNNAVFPLANTTFADVGVTTATNASPRMAGNSAFDGTVDNFSVKKVTAYSANQGTSAARPTWQANSGKPYLLFDGVDDCLLTTLLPAASMTLVACFRAGAAANQVVIGAQTAAANNDRCMLGVNSNGQIAGAWGSVGISTTIAGSANIAGADVVGLLRGNASTVELWLNGQQVYKGAPAGNSPANNTTVPFMLGADNGNGSAAFLLNGRISSAAALQGYVADSNVVPLMRQLGAANGITF